MIKSLEIFLGTGKPDHLFVITVEFDYQLIEYVLKELWSKLEAIILLEKIFLCDGIEND